MAAAEAPELRDRGDRGSGDLSRAPSLPRCAQISGGPARNRAVFINGRRLERVICPSRETATRSAKHKARSAKSGSQARAPSFAHSPPKLMKTAQILASLPPLKMYSSSSSFPIEGCEVKDAGIPLLMRSRLQKSQDHARRGRKIGKPEATVKGRYGLPRRIDDESPRASELRDL